MLRIRLARRGSVHGPFYRFVVSDSKRRPGATAVDTIGFFDPSRKTDGLKLDVERAGEWIRKGAVPSARVEALLAKARKSGA